MGKHTSLTAIGAPTRENAESFVRLIVEAFRDAANNNPSVEIAVEEIMMTFEDVIRDAERWRFVRPILKVDGDFDSGWGRRPIRETRSVGLCRRHEPATQHGVSRRHAHG